MFKSARILGGEALDLAKWTTVWGFDISIFVDIVFHKCLSRSPWE